MTRLLVTIVAVMFALLVLSVTASWAFCLDCTLGVHTWNYFDSNTVTILDPNDQVHVHNGPNDSTPKQATCTLSSGTMQTWTMSSTGTVTVKAVDIGLTGSWESETTSLSTVSVTVNTTGSCQCNKGHCWRRFYKTIYDWGTCACGCGCSDSKSAWKKQLDTQGASNLPACNPISGCDE